MAIFNAADELYELCELDGKPVAFTNMRLDRQTVSDGLYCYDVRDSDNLDGSCAEVKPHVMVNHWGTILCKSPFADRLEAAKKQVEERAAAAPPVEHTQNRSSGHRR